MTTLLMFLPKLSKSILSSMHVAHCKGECYDSPVVDKTKSRRGGGGALVLERQLALYLKF